MKKLLGILVLKKLKLKKNFFLIIFITIVIPNITIAKVTYLEILNNPTDLKLNLEYAKEKEQAGEYKATIATLERLSMLYPVNTDIKLYLLSILLRIDSNAKLELMIETMLQDPNTTDETRNYILGILKTIKDQTKPKNKWFAYADFNYMSTKHSNIEGVSKTRTLWAQDNEIEFSEDTIQDDKTSSRGASLTLGKNIDSTSAISFNTGIALNDQKHGKAEVNDITSGSMSYSKIFGKHYILPFIYYSGQNYRYTDDLSTKGVGFANAYNINKNNRITYGSNFSDTRYNKVTRNEEEIPDNQNSKTYSVNVGYNYTFSDINLISSKISYSKKNAKANYNAYKSPSFNIGFTRLFPFGTLKIDKTYQRNIHDEKQTFINSINDRVDDTQISKIQLTGEINQLMPFMKKINPKNQLFYSIKFTEADTHSTLLNNSAIRRTTSFNIIKRFSLYE